MTGWKNHRKQEACTMTSGSAVDMLIVPVVVVTAYDLLAKEPPSGWPINLLHLLTSH
jgi:hypothetical protein